MRKRLLQRALPPFLVLLAAFLLLTLLFLRVYTLITLLFEDGARDMITARELERLEGEVTRRGVVRVQKIPKIIHQTYKDEEVPAKWKEAQMACVGLHRGWEYMFWTDATARQFIAEEYGWFLDTFDRYPYTIQRSDAIRYFVLWHYGGIYIDLDEVNHGPFFTEKRTNTSSGKGCIRPLDPLLAFPAFFRLTTPTGISNDIMGSTPHHPFILRVIQSLQSFDRNWFVPYITVMYTTGPLFLSVMWMEYIRGGGENVRVLGAVGEEGVRWAYWSNAGGGSSWHRGDAKVIIWMGDHWVFLTFLGFTLAGCFFLSLWRVYCRLYHFRAPRIYRKSTAMSYLQRLLWLPLSLADILPPSSKRYERRLEEYHIE
ncbi:MAG: hypothetical protein M1839_008915 [Geoglossum umbratile]|nr:MAG: hypothetical protein M1839_008915 [Geoglossum umbratile]